MTPVRLEPVAPRSRVKHSTTEPLRSRFVLVSNLFRLGLTNIYMYSIDEYKKQSLLVYLKCIVLYKLIHKPILDFTVEQILFYRLSENTFSVCIFYIFLDCLAHISASCTKFLRS